MSHLSLTQASAQTVCRVFFGLQSLQVSFQAFFSLTDVLKEISGFCTRLHSLENIKPESWVIDT